MLEIRNVTKTYRPKKGVPVRALDNVSLKFEEKGMVFILGKSGSGKSTLLNVLGGLDRADEGEFIIKGKSSKDFSQSDFDSYRNTFIGFIFQEYNILPEFTVGANIALAMELQGKKATNEALNEILEEVDLTGYGNRKPNELSGGQKQRVAIARALIKQPEMIFADEPTGALDSATGKQVFDTLKKLSREKLVLIVSHDRDFAELYADRIIELKDGQVISDVVKTSLPPQEVSSGMTVVDNNVIRIKKGYSLTPQDLKLINDYISAAEGDTIISLDEKKNVEIKKTIKMNEGGGKDAFLDTKPDDIKLKEYTPGDAKLIRSRLPYRNSLKIGASGLKAKPFRLVLTIFLSMIAFALFGLTDTLAAYDKYTTYERSIIDGKINTAAFTKQFEYRPSQDDDYTYWRSSGMSDTDLIAIKNGSGVDVIPVYNGNSSGYMSVLRFDSECLVEPTKIQAQTANGNASYMNFYQGGISGYAELTQDILDRTGITLEGAGSRLPAAPGEIVITRYVYEHFALAGLKYLEESKDGNIKWVEISASDIHSPDDVLGKPFTVSGFMSNTFTIVGVADTHFDSSAYDAFKPSDQPVDDDNLLNYAKYNEMTACINYSFHALGFVAPGEIDRMISDRTSQYSGVPEAFASYDNSGCSLNVVSNEATDNYGPYVSGIAPLSALTDTDAILWADSSPRTQLAANGIIVPAVIDTSDNAGVPIILDGAKAKLVEKYGDEVVNDALTQMGYSENPFTYDVLMDVVAKLEIEKYVDGAPFPATDEFESFVCAKYGIHDSAEINDRQKREAYFEYLKSDTVPVDVEEGGNFRRVDIPGGYFVNSLDPNGKAGYELIRPTLKDVLLAEGDPVPGGSFGSGGRYDYNNDESGRSKYGEYVVVGYILPSPELAVLRDEGNGEFLSGLNFNFTRLIVASDDTFAELLPAAENKWSYVIGVLPYDNASAVRRIVEFNYANHDGVMYSLQNAISSTLDMVNDMVEVLSQVFLYVGIFFAVFAALMMFNFITVSISYKKREIGILRAVGARSGDVFGIFFNESLIITLINWVLAVVVTFVVTFIINYVVRTNYGFALTLLVVGIRQVALILGVGVLVAFVGSFIPVMKIARKRPIDAIQNR